LSAVTSEKPVGHPPLTIKITELRGRVDSVWINCPGSENCTIPVFSRIKITTIVRIFFIAAPSQFVPSWMTDTLASNVGLLACVT
jgi:hypothetical protein